MSQKPRILIVDDEPLARETLAELLLPQDYDLFFAANGIEALYALDELYPDVILLDVMMPQMDGYEVCRRINGHETGQHVPVILITALDGRGNLLLGLNAGADEFLTKPVNGPELRARVRSMVRIKKQYDELAATLQLREDLVNMIVHDMRNPLATILLHTGMMLRQEMPDLKYEKSLRSIHAQVRRLDSFVNDMLMVAKMENGRFILNRSPVDVSQLVEKIQQNAALLAESAGVHLRLDLDNRSEIVCVDQNLFSRVIDNLLSNALKFSPDGGKIVIRVRYPRAQNQSQPHLPAVLVQVLDEGSGIPEDYRSTIFDKFKIVDLKQEGLSQVGLGLAFCKMVIDAHGGRISVDSNIPQGSIFSVEIW